MSADFDTPSSPRGEERVRQSFARQGVSAHLRATLHVIRWGLVRIRLLHCPELTQQHGSFHARGTSAIANSAGGYAGYTLFPDNSSVLTVEFKLNLLIPAQGDFLEAVGRMVKWGRPLTIVQLEVFADRSGDQVQFALGQQTFMCMAGRPDAPRQRNSGTSPLTTKRGPARIPFFVGRSRPQIA